MADNYIHWATMRTLDLIIDLDDPETYHKALNSLEAAICEHALVKTGSQSAAARALGVNRGTYRQRLKKHGLLQPQTER